MMDIGPWELLIIGCVLMAGVGMLAALVWLVRR
ncbi:twin-arginine translocase TatA/TatE family subunit [Actinoallomurus vinaceus]